MRTHGHFTLEQGWFIHVLPATWHLQDYTFIPHERAWKEFFDQFNKKSRAISRAAPFDIHAYRNKLTQSNQTLPLALE